MCICMGFRKIGAFIYQNRAIYILPFLKKGLIIYLAALKKGLFVLALNLVPQTGLVFWLISPSSLSYILRMHVPCGRVYRN